MISGHWGCGVPGILPWDLLALPIAPLKPQLIGRTENAPLLNFSPITEQTEANRLFLFLKKETIL